MWEARRPTPKNFNNKGDNALLVSFTSSMFTQKSCGFCFFNSDPYFFHFFSVETVQREKDESFTGDCCFCCKSRVSMDNF